MRRFLAVTLAWILLTAAVISSVHAELISKTYLFKKGVTLEMGADVGEGLRLDSIRFYDPASFGSRLMRPGGGVKAEVQLSNSGGQSRRFGIAIALFDDQDRLLGVASGGSKFLSLKPERQSTYTLVFSDVKAEASEATRFKISVEPRF